MLCSSKRIQELETIVYEQQDSLHWAKVEGKSNEGKIRVLQVEVEDLRKEFQALLDYLNLKRHDVPRHLGFVPKYHTE